MSIKARVSPYDYEFDPDGQSTAARIARLIGHGQRVLELGCGYGVISRQLSQKQGCRVTGVEIDADSAEYARPWLDQLYVGSLEEQEWQSAVIGEYDVVVSADVVEHLRDPERILVQLKSMLGKDGRMVISIPNVGHAGIIAALLMGRFDYTATGLLDETHLRFFTWDSFERMLNRIGMEVVHRETVDAGGWHEQFSEYWSVLPPSLRELLNLHPTANVFQYVLSARASDNPRRLDVPDLDALEAWRAGLGG